MSQPVPSDGLLVADVGNTRVGLGVAVAGGVHDVRRVSAHDAQSLRETLDSLRDGPLSELRRPSAVMSSVNPPAASMLAELIEEVLGCEALRIRDDIPLPLVMEVDRPEEVGADRVCSAAAAYERVGGACAIVSMGTAITIDCVSPEGSFLGGAILPGLALGAEVLHTGTRLLPLVEIGRPAGVFGRNTQDAIVNGLVYGAVGAIREIVERYATDLGQWPTLLMTGGDALMVRELADFVDAVVPDLCLAGVALAHRKATAR